LAQEAVNYPDREEACFAMMEKGPAYGAWNEFCYVPVNKRLALGEAVQPTDIIVCLSQRVAGLSVEKIMIVFAMMYYSEFLDSSNVSCKRKCELLKKILNADKEIANLPCLLIDAMNETVRKEALPISAERCSIVPAMLGDDIGDYGAIGVAKEYAEGLR
jgi:hypothetical protein